MASSLTFDLTDGIARVTINRPDKLNALNAIVIAELGDAVTRIETDPAIRGVIVTGTGSKAFVAGADINELTEKGVTGGQKRALAEEAVSWRWPAISGLRVRTPSLASPRSNWGSPRATEAPSGYPGSSAGRGRS